MPRTVLIAQIAAALFVWYTGTRIRLFQTDWLDATLTVIWIVGITNAMNFLDNMDGLLAGISAVISAVFLVLAVLSGQWLIGALAAPEAVVIPFICKDAPASLLVAVTVTDATPLATEAA